MRTNVWRNGEIVSVDTASLNLPSGPPIPTVEEYRVAIQFRVEETAKSRGYDNAVSCASYVNSTNPAWSSEASVFIAWRDAVWTYTYGELEKVQSGLRSQPTVRAFVSELPEITWPSEE